MNKMLVLFHFLFISIIGINAAACSSSKADFKTEPENYKSDNTKFSFTINENGKKKYFEVEFANDSILSLTINGEKIKNENINDYEDEIYSKLNDLHRKNYFSFKFHNPSFDKKEFKEEMKKLKKELKEKRIEINAAILNDSLIKKNVENALKNIQKNDHVFHFDFDRDDLQEALSKLNDELDNLDFNLDINMDFDFDKIDIEIEKAMKKLGEVHIELNDLDDDLEKLSSFSDALRTELVKDKLIESKNDDLDIEISENAMIVNDKKVRDTLLKKYKKLYKEHFGEELEGKRRFEIHK